MKVLLKGSEFAPFDGKVVEVTLDESGDARLPEHVKEHTNRHFAMRGEFVVLTEEQSVGYDKARYVVHVPVEDLLALHLLLDTMPEHLVESAILVEN